MYFMSLYPSPFFRTPLTTVRPHVSSPPSSSDGESLRSSPLFSRSRNVLQLSHPFIFLSTFLFSSSKYKSALDRTEENESESTSQILFLFFFLFRNPHCSPFRSAHTMRHRFNQPTLIEIERDENRIRSRKSEFSEQRSNKQAMIFEK